MAWCASTLNCRYDQRIGAVHVVRLKKAPGTAWPGARIPLGLPAAARTGRSATKPSRTSQPCPEHTLDWIDVGLKGRLPREENRGQFEDLVGLLQVLHLRPRPLDFLQARHCSDRSSPWTWSWTTQRRTIQGRPQASEPVPFRQPKPTSIRTTDQWSCALRGHELREGTAWARSLSFSKKIAASNPERFSLRLRSVKQ